MCFMVCSTSWCWLWVWWIFKAMHPFFCYRQGKMAKTLFLSFLDVFHNIAKVTHTVWVYPYIPFLETWINLTICLLSSLLLWRCFYPQNFHSLSVFLFFASSCVNSRDCVMWESSKNTQTNNNQVKEFTDFSNLMFDVNTNWTSWPVSMHDDWLFRYLHECAGVPNIIAWH